jgi:hypothetical protein
VKYDKVVALLDAAIQELRGSLEPLKPTPVQNGILDIVRTYAEQKELEKRSIIMDYIDFMNSYRTLMFQLPRCSGKTEVCKMLLQEYPSAIGFSGLNRTGVLHKLHLLDDVIGAKPWDFSGRIVLFDEVSPEKIHEVLFLRRNVIIDRNTLIVGVYT